MTHNAVLSGKQPHNQRGDAIKRVRELMGIADDE